MDSLAEWLTAGGVGAFLATTIILMRIAITAERGRADDWRTVAQTQASVGKVQEEHIRKLILAVEQLTSVQQQTLEVVRRLDPAGRSPS